VKAGTVKRFSIGAWWSDYSNAGNYYLSAQNCIIPSTMTGPGFAADSPHSA